MIEEEESNKKLSARKQGEWVTYGNEIQLMHYDSKGNNENKFYLYSVSKRTRNMSLT